MKVAGSCQIDAPRERVFSALMDPAVLLQCIPGCESLTASGENTYQAQVRLGLPGMKGLYTGRVEIKDVEAPAAYAMVVDGKGAQSIVRGTARMQLVDGDGGTRIAYDADVEVGGVLAAVGSRLVQGTARMMMDSFFAAFRKQL